MTLKYMIKRKPMSQYDIDKRSSREMAVALISYWGLWNKLSVRQTPKETGDFGMAKVQNRKSRVPFVTKHSIKLFHFGYFINSILLYFGRYLSHFNQKPNVVVYLNNFKSARCIKGAILYLFQPHSVIL